MKNNLVFSGKVEYISSPEKGESKNGKPYEKQFICVKETDGEYPNEGIFEVFNKQNMLSNISVGSIVEVSFNMKVNAYNGKYYGSNSIWKIEEVTKEKLAPTPSTKEPERAVKAGNEDLPIDDNQDLPF